MDLTPEQFEKLLCEFCKQDLPPNFSIKHNVKTTGGESEHERQIDTRITGKLGVSDMLICGEAKNWNTKVGIETIDGLVGKYLTSEVRANKVLLFSNQGYTEPAERRAKILGIELLQPQVLGTPIQRVPVIAALCYLGQMIVRMIYDGTAQTLMSIDRSRYDILKGKERISFDQNVMRLAVQKLRAIPGKDIFSDLTKLHLEDHNVLYEFKDKPGHRYDMHFEVELSTIWDYFVELLPMGLLYHVNSDQKQFVNLQMEPEDLLRNVLMSPTRENYESKDECIEHVVKKNKAYLFLPLCVDPDQNKLNPAYGKFIPI